MADFLFTQFNQQNLRSGTDLVLTSGRSLIGQASGSYVADGLATPALLAAHPRFVAQSSNGRIFRALPADGELPVELGGAIGDGQANDQPAIQAAIAYAEAIGVRTITFGAATYRLHCPVRTSEPAGAASEHYYDGHPIVVSSPLVLRSVRHGGSRLAFRHVDGSPRGPNYQLVMSPATGQPTVWRGGGIFLRCPALAPADYADRPGLTLIDLTLDGGIPRSGFYDWPARASDGDGWDITDKGIWVEGDRISGDIRLIRTTVSGFRGELIYQAGSGNGEIQIRAAVLSDTNGNLIQAGGTSLDIDGLIGRNAFQAYEGWAGRNGRMVNTVFENCVKTGGIAGGRFSPGAFNNAPTRMDDGQAPWLVIDAQFNNCGVVRLGSWVRGQIRLTDSFLMLDANEVYREGLHDVDLEVLAQVDQLDNLTAAVLVGSATAGAKTLSDIRLRLQCYRSEEARANARVHTQPVESWGSIGPNVVIEHGGGEAKRNSGPAGNPLSDVPDFLPCFRANRWVRTATDWSGTLQDIAAAPQIVPRADFMAVYTAAPGTWPVSLPVAGIGHGHDLLIRNIAAPGTFVSLAASGAGAALPARRIIAPGERIALRFDAETGQWFEVQPPAALKGSAVPMIAVVPAGQVSPELVVACPGAAAGMAAQVAPAADPGADFEICGVRAVTDQVRFRLRNLGAAAAAPPTLTWTATAAFAA